jgi:integrase
MAKKTTAPDSFFTFNFLRRKGKHGKIVIYARLIEKSTGVILAQRSTGTDDERMAAAKAGQLLLELPLANMARAHAAKLEAGFDNAEQLRNKDFATFCTWFWSSKSDYLMDKVSAEKPLSSDYIKTQSRYIKKHVADYAPFKHIPLRGAGILIIEQWMRSLKRNGVSNNVIIDVMNAIRTPLSWARKRNLLDEPFILSGIERPKEHHRKRGILTRSEVAKLVALETLDIIKPRPRLKAGQKNTGPASIDIRMKAVVLLSELAAMRRGEIRALHWYSVDFDRGVISVENNFVDSDGFKDPKRESAGIIPIADDLLPILIELKSCAFKLGRAKPEDFVIFNADPDVPAAEVTIRRGFHRALALIGIEDDSIASKEKRPPHPGSQQDRHLVLHSGRHGAATRMAESLGAQTAARITRHRSAQAFMGYADHDTDEMFAKAREALNVTDI